MIESELISPQPRKDCCWSEFQELKNEREMNKANELMNERMRIMQSTTN